MKPASLLRLLLVALALATASLAVAKSDSAPPVPYSRAAHFSKRWNPSIQPDRPAIILHPAPLIYPAAWRNWGQPAYAVVEFLVLETGRPDQVQCTEATDRAFAKAAEKTISDSFFIPALKDQQGTCSKMVQRLEFKLQPTAPAPSDAPAATAPAKP